MLEAMELIKCYLEWKEEFRQQRMKRNACATTKNKSNCITPNNLHF